jgi:Superfamily II DNA/RNA helicases, SNF2 family
MNQMEIVFNGTTAVMTFQYNQSLVNCVKRLDDRKYNPKEKSWTTDTMGVIELLKDDEFKRIPIKLTMSGKIEDEKLAEELPKLEDIDLDKINFDFKTKPFQHQLNSFAYAMTKDKFVLGDDMGLGKTKQVIDIATYRKQQNGLKRCLIICCVNSLKSNWIKEIGIHSNEKGVLIGGSKKTASNKDKADHLKNLRDDEFFLVTNIESLRNEDVLKELVKLCKSGEIGMIAADEVHKCKNPSSQQGKALLQLETRFKIAMTGTPLMNSPLDLYVPLKWLGIEKTTYYKFRTHFCVFGVFNQIEGYKNLDQLSTKLNQHSLRRLKGEVVDLPDKIYMDEYVTMSAKQKQIYNSVVNDIKANLDKIRISPNPLGKLIRLRQATGHPELLTAGVNDSAKMDRLIELVEELNTAGKKVVVFSNWVKMTDVIRAKLQHLNTAYVCGEVKEVNRLKEIERFQETDCNVIVGTIAALGTGYTLSNAEYVIFFDEPWTAADKRQAEDRAHRIGTKHNVTIITLLTENTVDVKVNDIVKRKGDISDKVVDGRTREQQLELLNFILDI